MGDRSVGNGSIQETLHTRPGWEPRTGKQHNERTMKMSREKRKKNNAANLEGRRVAELKLSRVREKTDEEIRVVKDGANDYLKKAEEDVTKLALEVEQLTTQSVGCLRAAQGHAQELREGDLGWSPAMGEINRLYTRMTDAETAVDRYRQANEAAMAAMKTPVAADG